MARYIDKDKALNAITYAELGQEYEAVAAIPTADVVEVVRCRDCEYSVEHYDTDGNAPYWICKNWDGGTDADGFCYEAERK